MLFHMSLTELEENREWRVWKDLETALVNQAAHFITAYI
jgi:hypothetical protein